METALLKKHLSRHKPYYTFAGISLFVAIFFFGVARTFVSTPSEYVSAASENAVNDAPTTTPEVVNTVVHLPTPEPLKGIYMTAWIAGSRKGNGDEISRREEIVKFIEASEINAIVIDIKDATGEIAYHVSDPELAALETDGNRIPDIKDFISELHKKNIYVIGRVAVFQDPAMVKKHPEWAVVRASDGAIWKDHKGISWIDAGARGQWDYVIKIAKDAYAQGFDEINFDYVRFPSDGNMKDIAYKNFDETKMTKPDQIREFFRYLHSNLTGTGMVLSVDLFGMTTTAQDDMNIGQLLENAFPFFDYVAPMVYPSHFPPNYNGYPNPNNVPYEIINHTMKTAVDRATAASSSPSKLRPWLQDFDYGGNYDEAKVRAQIKAVYDSGLTSWMMWDPGVRYTRSAYNPAQ